MLTTAQADHFATFGFAVLPGFLAEQASEHARLVEGRLACRTRYTRVRASVM
jgi:hypothetical protein